VSIRHIAWAFDQDLKSGPKFVLVALANYADEDGYCYPSQERIAADTGQGESTVRAHLKLLEEGGESSPRYIERRERRRANGTRDNDGYQLLAPDVALAARRRRTNRQNPAVDSGTASAGSNRQNPAADNRQISAHQPPDFSTPYKEEPSVEPSVATTTTPLYPPAGSLPVVHDTDPALPAAIPAPTAPAAVPDQPAPASPPTVAEADAVPAGELTRDQIEAAISQVIIAANQAQAAHPGIDQVRLRPIPTTGRGRQDVWDWIAEGIPISLVLEVVREAVREYQPDGHRTQISSMSYFAARIREANELRRAREAPSNEHSNGRAQRNGRDDRERVPATGRGTAGRSEARRPGSERRRQFVYE
jgi:hypothetical protein